MITEIAESVIKFTAPLNNEKYRIGDKIPFLVNPADEKIKIDSIVFTNNGQVIGKSSSSPFTMTWNAGDACTGNQKIFATAYFNKDKKETTEINILILSDESPKTYTYKIVKAYPHDPEAYTQGLYFEKGFLFEGTGEWGTSSLRKVKPETGEIIKSLNLPDDIFGEGIASVGNKIIQLTWKSNQGFVYDKETFRQINKFNYSTEGWGITTDGKRYIMSDGTAYLYFLDPETFSQIRSIEVCNDIEPVYYLNELEYIKGEIWANVYQENYIVRIDPESGKVLGKVDFSGILDLRGYTKRVDVLNGIAWDAKGNRIFITGKWWPKLFEVEVIEKK